MDISLNALRKDIVSTLSEVNLMLGQQEQLDEPMNRSDRATLLLAKSECLNALINLRGKK